MLRLAVALAFGFGAWAHYSRRSELTGLGLWLWLMVIVEVLIALSLAVGAYTQVAALAALVLCVVYAIFAKKYPRATPLCRGEYILLAVISLSLMLTGAGALAQDLPL